MGRSRWARLGLLAAALIAFAAGCGGDDDTADSGTASTIDLNADAEPTGQDGTDSDTNDGDTTNSDAVGDQAGDDTADIDETSNTDVDQANEGADPAPSIVVSETSFGPAELCMTRDDLEAALPDLVVGPYEDQGALADTEGLTVTDTEGNVEFYAMAVVGEGPRLQIFMTDNARYQTDAGVGPGTELAVAASVYGPATLSYSVEGESREYASFVAGPANIEFRTGTGGDAGIYATEEGYNETQDYEPSAPIQSIEIYSFDC